MLLVIYIMELVTITITAAIYTRPNALIGMLVCHELVCRCYFLPTVETAQVLKSSICSVSYNIETNWSKYVTVPQFALGALLCILAVFQCIRESYHTHGTSAEWQLNKYTSLLVREGVLYFLG